ncbi:MAG: aspartate kinase [Alphaproteobacteria bacterium]|jgi:aspartate kinase|nr:aspartate kinase [Rickettsiales bacterium]
MALIVQKFGGTSVGDCERIQHVATLVKREAAAGHQVIVVVSAMAGVTNQLVDYCQTMNSLMTPEAQANYDHVVSSGEQITSGLLALALESLGLKARAWCGWQLPLRSDNMYSKARIDAIETAAIHASFARGEIAVVAGFQGITAEGRISTLGRGGSDTSAVALAAAFGADRCDIYTDVDGVYTCDPRIVKRAQKLHRVSYEEMLEMASLGSKVLQTRSVELAMNYGVKVQVLSTFDDRPADSIPGTLLVDEEEIVEKHRVTGIAYSRDEARVTLTNVENRPGVSAGLFGPLAEAGINVDMIVQNVTEDGKQTDITFTVGKTDLARALDIVKHDKRVPKCDSVHSDAGVAKVSVIGVGMRSHAGVAAEMFRTLAEKNINIIVISTSEIKTSVLIDESYLELALRALHTAYGLDAAEEKN